MEVITITIEYDGEVTLNNEYTCKCPIEMSWFPRNDLLLEANGIKRVINTDKTVAGQSFKLPGSIFE
jgi:hypothetical protein